MRSRLAVSVCAMATAILLGGVVTAASADVLVGSGSSVDLGTGTVEQGCGDLAVAGTVALSQGTLSGVRSLSIVAGGQLQGGAGEISWSGVWSDSGQFLAGLSTARSIDGCGMGLATIGTGETFHALALESS